VEKMKIGLVLEGGAMRGMFTAGVLDAFLDEKIHFDGIVGVSAGALFGVNYLSEQKGRVIRYNKRFNGDRRYMGLIPLLREGNIVSTSYAYDKVPRYLDVFDDARFRASEIPFYAVITDMETGQAVYRQIHSVFDEMDVLRASGSMPFVSRPVLLRGKKYMDGAIADSIPYAWLAEQGYDKLVVVLTRDSNYRKKPISRRMAQLRYRKYPAFAQAIATRHERYNAQVEQLLQWEADGRAFVIRPSCPIEIGRIEKDPDKLQAVYELGVRDAQTQLEALRDYLK
jgi:predicted patatin/cPLA2 family phospholipase